MKQTESWKRVHRSGTRFALMLVAGVVVAVATGLLGHWEYAPIAGWAAASITYVVWVWAMIGRMDAATTASHATREDPARPVADLLIVLASIASLGAIVLLLIGANGASNSVQVIVAVLAIFGIALSWLLVHTLFTLRYASLYYQGVDGGVDFNQKEPPSYGDFAYLAFTLGMTFQVSDTNLTSHEVRMTALRHGLLSYLFGSVILASLINLIAGLSSSPS
ncbi:DUF1345 domain-containing protein [Leifsonia kafniensis]|uniref:DUF1345 domain-containing protein n=1 Tax=Leifsonia kafniensis TaxID=475957 RepID=A0ABP7K6U4_9MICO